MKWRARQTAFYGSVAWQNCRERYKRKKGGLCEVCLMQGKITPGEIVHHKVHLHSRNINDPKVALNEDNLQLVCRQCHERIHKGRRYTVDEWGRVHI